MFLGSLVRPSPSVAFVFVMAAAAPATFESNDRVREALCRMVQYLRKNHAENLEFEIRLGQFTTDNEFEPGYRHEHLSVVSRLRHRIEANTRDPRLSSQWKSAEPMYLMMRCEYDGGVRKTCRNREKDQPDTEEYILKRRMGKVDILSDRPYHFRASVSRETKLNITPAHHLYKTVTQNPPKSVRYVLRASFLETVPAIEGTTLGTEHNQPFVFQWDISKVSDSGVTKKQATEGQCVYHCEFELRNKLVPVDDKEKEHQLNNLVVDLVVARMRALSGSHIIEKSVLSLPPQQTLPATEKAISSSASSDAVTYLPLPPAQLSLLVKDV